MKSRQSKGVVTPERFVQVWERSTRVAEVAWTLGLTYGSCAARASSYRRMGVRLKHMPNHGNPGKRIVVVSRLNRIIADAGKVGAS